MNNIEQIYREHRRQYVNRAYSLLRNMADAEDAVQDAFVQALEQRQTINDPLHWLRAAVRHICVDTQRTAGCHAAKLETIASAESYEQPAPNFDLLNLIRRAMTKLTLAERENLGATTSRSSRAAQKAHERALKHLREILRRTQAFKEGALTTCA